MSRSPATARPVSSRGQQVQSHQVYKLHYYEPKQLIPQQRHHNSNRLVTSLRRCTQVCSKPQQVTENASCCDFSTSTRPPASYSTHKYQYIRTISSDCNNYNNSRVKCKVPVPHSQGSSHTHKAAAGDVCNSHQLAKVVGQPCACSKDKLNQQG